MNKISLAIAAAFASIAFPAGAAVVNIDLSGATSGTLIHGVGADFSQTFTGQTVSGDGIGITGSPAGPLSLTPAGEIDVADWAPGVSPESNSLLSQPGNGAPLSILLASNANSFAWTMGSGQGGSITLDFFSSGGALVGTKTVDDILDYQTYSFSGLPTFAGLTFFEDTDASGLRFQNMSYNAVTTAVPEPTSWALMLAGVGVVARVARRRNA